MDKVPVFVLTGFLGAGKSTLLNRLLQDPAFADTAIIINEFGDVALDHDLVRVGPNQVARTTTGCLCCTRGGDVRATLHELAIMRDAGAVSFARVIIETTGLADPAPLVNRLTPGAAPAFGLRDHLVARAFALAGVVTAVDAVSGDASIDSHFEAAKQIAFADRIVLTKSDLVPDPSALHELRETIAGLNAIAPISQSAGDAPALARLFQPRAYSPTTLGEDVIGWLALEAAIQSSDTGQAKGGQHGTASSPDRHGGRIRTFAVTRDEPVDADSFGTFLALLSRFAGPRLLRVKGLVCRRDDGGRPHVIHVVQHVVHPAHVLDAWPSDDRRTRLVFITDGIDPGPVRQLFEATLGGRPAHPARSLRNFLSTAAAALSPAPTRPLRRPDANPDSWRPS